MRVIGDTEKIFMKNIIEYTNEPIKARVVHDFLPKPEELAVKDEKERITLVLSKKSVVFFKKEAKKQGASYQAMIRRLIDFYVANQ